MNKKNKACYIFINILIALFLLVTSVSTSYNNFDPSKDEAFASDMDLAYFEFDSKEELNLLMHELVFEKDYDFILFEYDEENTSLMFEQYQIPKGMIGVEMQKNTGDCFITVKRGKRQFAIYDSVRFEIPLDRLGE